MTSSYWEERRKAREEKAKRDYEEEDLCKEWEDVDDEKKEGNFM